MSVLGKVFRTIWDLAVPRLILLAHPGFRDYRNAQRVYSSQLAKARKRKEAVRQKEEKTRQRKQLTWWLRLPSPKNLKPADRDPNEPNEIIRIIAACDEIARVPKSDVAHGQ